MNGIDWEALREKHADDEPLDPTLYCEDCGEPIGVWDSYYDIDGQIYCEDCMMNYHKINR